MTDVTAEDEARSIGAAAISPAVVASRLGGTNDPGGSYCYQASAPLWGVPAITAFPYGGSAIAFFDAGPVGADQYGTQPPPADVSNLTGGDPHEAPRRACAAQQQKSGFLRRAGPSPSPRSRTARRRLRTSPAAGSRPVPCRDGAFYPNGGSVLTLGPARRQAS